MLRTVQCLSVAMVFVGIKYSKMRCYQLELLTMANLARTGIAMAIQKEQAKQRNSSSLLT